MQDEDKKTVMDKRSSLRSWKERIGYKKLHRRKLIGVAVMSLAVLVIIASFYGIGNRDTIGHQDNKSEKKNDSSQKTTPISKTTPIPIKKNSSTPKTINTTNISKAIVTGKIGMPVVNNGLEITVKNIVPSVQFTNVWVIVKNLENDEKPFILKSGTVVIDNTGRQYERIKVPKSAEISETNLYPFSIREGAIFFERLRDTNGIKKLILNISGDKTVFIINSNTN